MPTWDKFPTESRTVKEFKNPYRKITSIVDFTLPPIMASIDLPRLPEIETIEQAAEQSISSVGTQKQIGGITEGVMLRAEVVNSSRIEGSKTSARKLTLAVSGAMSKPGAIETARNIDALMRVLGDKDKSITLDSLKSDHAIIMASEPFAGNVRSCPAWIGNTIFTAEYVAPPDDRVQALLSDWVVFANRTDISIVPHVAVSHAQFESIHPFEDGNGRTGRVATQRQLLSAGYPALPVSIALFRLKNYYYDSLTAYRNGDLQYSVVIFAIAIWAASKGLSDSIKLGQAILDKWLDQAAVQSQRNSNKRRALEWIAENPAFSLASITEHLDVSERTVRRIIAELEAAGIISNAKTSTYGSKLNRKPMWEAKDIHSLLDRIEESVIAYVDEAIPPDIDDHPTSQQMLAHITETMNR